MADARRLVEESVADERQAVAGLVLQSAAAKLRRSADLSLRASLDRRRPVESAPEESLLACRSAMEDSSSENIVAFFDPEANNNRSSLVLASCGQGHGETNDIGGGRPAESRKKHQFGENGQVLVGTAKKATPSTSVGCASSSLSSSSENEGFGGGGGCDRRCIGGGVEGVRRGLENPGKQEQERSSTKSSKAHQDAMRPPGDGLQALKREISILESKILGRLDGSGGGGGGYDDDNNNSASGDSVLAWKGASSTPHDKETPPCAGNKGSDKNHDEAGGAGVSDNVYSNGVHAGDVEYFEPAKKNSAGWAVGKKMGAPHSRE